MNSVYLHTVGSSFPLRLPEHVVCIVLASCIQATDQCGRWAPAAQRVSAISACGGEPRPTSPRVLPYVDVSLPTLPIFCVF